MNKKIITIKDCEDNESDYNCISKIVSSKVLKNFQSSNNIGSLEFEQQPLIELSYKMPIQNVLRDLLSEIQILRDKVETLEKINLSKKENALLIQDTLKDIWDNEKDDIWASL